jgi:O-antigen/teichoic acid export membrane protein
MVATLSAVVGAAAFADLGVGSGLVTLLASSTAMPERVTMQRLVSNAAACLLSLGSLIAVALTICAFTVDWPGIFGVEARFARDLEFSVVALGVSIGGGIAASLGERILLGLQRGTSVNIWSAARSAAAFGGVAICALASAPMWCFVFAIVGLPAAVAVAESTWVLRVVAPDLRPTARRVTRPGMAQMLQLGGLFFALNVAVAVAYETDTLVIAAMKGAAAVAVFAVAARIFSLLSAVISAGSQQLWPAMTAALAQGDVAWVRSRVTRVLAGSLAVSSVGGGFFVVSGRALTRIWVGPSLQPPVALLVVLAAWTSYALVMSQLSLLLTAAQVVSPQVAMALSMAVVNVGLSILLTARFGLVGPILGSLIAHVVCAGVPTVVLSRRILRTRSVAV